MKSRIADWALVQALRLHLLTIVAVGSGIWMLSYQAWLSGHTIHTEATVLGPERLPARAAEKLHRSRTMLRIVVDGRRVECVDTSTTWSWTKYEVGDIVPALYYSSERFPECKIDTFSGRWLLGSVVLACGLGLWWFLGKVWVRRHDTPQLR